MPKELLLAETHAHSRDARIEFKEAEHVYILDGTYVFPRSVSRLVSESFDEFDAPGVARRCLKKWRADPSSKYHELILACESEIPRVDPSALICAAWGANGAHKSELGRMMHLSIELTLNGLEVAAPETGHVDDSGPDARLVAPKTIAALCSPKGTGLREEEARAVANLALAGTLSAGVRVTVTLPPAAIGSTEMRAWEVWRRTKGASLVPIRTEWSIYSTEHQIAGQIDAVFKCTKTGKIVLIDWKRVAGLERTAPESGGRRGKAPLEAFPDTKYWHYALQVNIYAYILAALYKVRVAEMRLVQIHPSLSAPGFAEHPIDFISGETIESLLRRPFGRKHA